jgi:dienelactone hydrolase
MAIGSSAGAGEFPEIMTHPLMHVAPRAALVTLILTGPRASVAAELPAAGPMLAGTALLTMEGEIDSELVGGVDRFLQRQLDRSQASRHRFWKRDFTSANAYQASLAPNRERLAHILGVRDTRVGFDALELLATTAAAAVVGQNEHFQTLAVRWPVVGEMTAEGLLLRPTLDRDFAADIVAIPDADLTPEQLIGLAPGVPAAAQYARRLAESGCRVLVPMIVSRARGEFTWRGHRPDLTNREFLYRPAFELGRHLIGYEVQKVLAAVDWFTTQQAAEDRRPVAVVGWGEGGLLALYSAALDPRIDAALVSGYFQPREGLWREPIDRNVFGLLEQFGDAELAAMVAPRVLIIEAARGPEVTLRGGPGAPGQLRTPPIEPVRGEVERARELVAAAGWQRSIRLVESDSGSGPFASAEALRQLLAGLGPDRTLAPLGPEPRPVGPQRDPVRRRQRQMREMDRHGQQVLRESPQVRREFLGGLDTSSLDDYRRSTARYREVFARQIVGCFDQPRLAAHPRTRRVYDEPGWTGYEVVLDVYPDVIAYGILLVPRDLRPGERRPVVVCQHGLEGRAQDVVAGDHPAYHDFAARLAERGFVTFAPQNLYRFGDRFRTLQRKANPLGKTLFSIITPQHQQIVDWLQALPFVDAGRIAFYGLSYGGKTAMRVPALVTDYCLSICSADFNDWVDKNASTHSPYSYVWTGEYEIFEFDLGSTFGYAEMAALIAPRPFMVERGHHDGVASDETVAGEFAKVRRLYQADLKIGARCRIEWFDGPHTIHGRGTFDFLHEHLQWPARQAARGAP